MTGATVTDSFPAAITSANWTCTPTGAATCTASGSGNISDTVDIPAGESVTYSVTANIDAGATGNLVNTASVSTSVGDPNPGDESATDTDTPAASADLTVTKDDGVATYTPGGSVTYTIVVGNAGPSDVTGATVTDTFPPRSRAPTGPAHRPVRRPVPLAAAGTSAIRSTSRRARVSPIDSPPTSTPGPRATWSTPRRSRPPSAIPIPVTRAQHDTDTPAASADLTVTKDDGVATYTPGGSVTYSIVVVNAGPSDVTGATVTDTFPAAITSANWTCTPTGAATTASGVTVDIPAVRASPTRSQPTSFRGRPRQHGIGRLPSAIPR